MSNMNETNVLNLPISSSSISPLHSQIVPNTETIVPNTGTIVENTIINFEMSKDDDENDDWYMSEYDELCDRPLRCKNPNCHFRHYSNFD